MPRKKVLPKPKVYKGDRVGFNLGSKGFTDANINRNAFAVAKPFLVDNEWYVSVNFNTDRFDSFWGKIRSAQDFNLPAKFVYVVEPRLRSRIKEKIMNKLSKPAIVTGIVLLTIAFFGFWLVGNYNSLVGARNGVSNSRAKIDTQLERRYELVDNIVESVKGSQAQESEVFGKIAEARKIGGSATSPEQEAEANNTIDTQIALLPRLQEAYPELRSNEQVTRLIGELQGTANSILQARNDYNDTVTNYNNNIAKFPKSVFAGMFNFDKEELFKARSEALNNPKVKF